MPPFVYRDIPRIEMVRERYSHIEAGELGDVATEALEEIDSVRQ